MMLAGRVAGEDVQLLTSHPDEGQLWLLWNIMSIQLTWLIVDHGSYAHAHLSIRNAPLGQDDVLVAKDCPDIYGAA